MNDAAGGELKGLGSCAAADNSLLADLVLQPNISARPTKRRDSIPAFSLGKGQAGQGRRAPPFASDSPSGIQAGTRGCRQDWVGGPGACSQISWSCDPDRILCEPKPAAGFPPL